MRAAVSAGGRLAAVSGVSIALTQKYLPKVTQAVSTGYYTVTNKVLANAYILTNLSEGALDCLPQPWQT